MRLWLQRALPPGYVQDAKPLIYTRGSTSRLEHAGAQLLAQNDHRQRTVDGA